MPLMKNKIWEDRSNEYERVPSKGKGDFAWWRPL